MSRNPMSLQEQCLRRVCLLLKRKTWDKYARNPFSSMPVKVMDVLINFMMSVPNFIRIKDLRLLFQSGQISRLDLSTLLVEVDKRLLSNWLSGDACKNLRILSIRHPLCNEEGITVVRLILQSCCNLEEFHSKSIIDLDALSYCDSLRSLRLHLRSPFDLQREDFRLKVFDFICSKPDLVTFSFCNMKSGYLAHKVLAAILESCPKLVSIGSVDCLEALQEIRRTRGDGAKLKLQRCIWGLKEDDDNLVNNGLQSSLYSKNFPEMIKTAVKMCPDVETVVINVYNEHCLEHLNGLKKLRSLYLRFHYSSADNVMFLTFLFRRIGPLLDHLSLDISESFPVEIIRDHCFNLRSLRIHGMVFLSDGMEDCLNSLLLEELYILKADPQSLYLLLRNSPNLVEMYLGNVSCFDDYLMDKILRCEFMFPRLKKIGIFESSLSPMKIKMLIERTCDLKELFFGTYSAYKLLHENVHRSSNFKILLYFDSFKLKNKEFYVYRPDPCTF